MSPLRWCAGLVTIGAFIACQRNAPAGVETESKGEAGGPGASDASLVDKGDGAASVLPDGGVVLPDGGVVLLDGGVTPPDSGPPPALGAHALAFQRYYAQPPTSRVSTLVTPAMATTSGSTILVGVGRGAFQAFASPTDNMGNGAFPQLGAAHTYTQWPTSGTALYARTAAAGGGGHTVSTSTPLEDELTMAAVEVVNGKVVHDFKWNEVPVNQPLTSLSVTTTGPATLVAFWWGDAGVLNDKTSTPNNGFTVIDSLLVAGEIVQCVVAAKSVAAPGTYNVTWTSTPAQGAQLWLVAVQ